MTTAFPQGTVRFVDTEK